MDFLELFGNAGGLLEIIKIIFSTLASPFALAKLKAIITSRIFYIPHQTRQKILNDFSNKQWSKTWLTRNKYGETFTKLPKSLFLEQIKAKCSCRRDYTEYEKLIELGHSSFTEELDITKIAKRMRLHGISLYYLLKPE